MLATITLAACATGTTTDTQAGASGASSVVSATAEWDTSDEASVTLADGASVASSAGVTIDGDVITITTAGVYRLTGSLSNGTVIVDVPDDGAVTLVLDNVTIGSSTPGAVQVLDAGSVTLWVESGSSNSISDAGTVTETSDASDDSDTPNAAIYSTADLTIAGDGNLTVAGNANDGITSKDSLTIDGPTIDVTAADDAVRGKDSVTIDGGTLTATAGGDAIRADNESTSDTGDVAGAVTINAGTIALQAGVDGIDAVGTVAINGGELRIASGDDAIHADAALSIVGGSIDVTESYEGLESSVIMIAGGEIAVTSSDDGINIAGGNDGSGHAPGQDQFVDTGQYYLSISGGTVTINADGDGIDVGGSVAITGGTVIVDGPTADNNGALDVDSAFSIDGGSLLAVGSAGMADSPDSGQATVSVRFQSSVPATAVIQIVDDSGNVLTEHTTAKQIASIVFSAPTLESGTTYDIVVDGQTVGTVTAR